MLPEVMTKAVRLVPQKARRDFLVSPRAPSYLWGSEHQQQSHVKGHSWGWSESV